MNVHKTIWFWFSDQLQLFVHGFNKSNIRWRRPDFNPDYYIRTGFSIEPDRVRDTHQKGYAQYIETQNLDQDHKMM